MPRHHRGWAMGHNPTNEIRHSPLAISMLEPALLYLLNEQPRHGYTLLADLGNLGMGTLHPSVVYRTLRELEGLGWIESAWETNQTQGPPRRIYCLTTQGKSALYNWQQELDKIQNIIDLLQKKNEPKGV